MLRILKSLKGLKINARDGHVGHIADFYFDDEEWIIRYFVIETGNWLFERKVLISPVSVFEADWASQSIDVELTKEQIENSPDVALDKPVSRQKEFELAKYYAWPTYWPIGETGVPMNEAAIEHTLEAHDESPDEGDNHLRSALEVFKYNIEAADDQVGSVDDLVVDDEAWIIRYLVINTKKLLPGKKILLSPTWIDQISWSTHTVHVGLSAETIKDGPTFDPTEPVNREIEERFYDFYGRPKYWSQNI